MSPVGRLFEPRSAQRDDAPTEGRPSLRGRHLQRPTARGPFSFQILREFCIRENDLVSNQVFAAVSCGASRH